MKQFIAGTMFGVMLATAGMVTAQLRGNEAIQELQQQRDQLKQRHQQDLLNQQLGRQRLEQGRTNERLRHLERQQRQSQQRQRSLGNPC